VDADAWLVRRPGTSPSAKPPPAESPPPPAPAVSEPNVGRRAAPSRRRQRSTEGQLADEHVAWIVRELDINCVIDVGANVGQFGRRLRRNGYRGRIVSFEPVREYADELRAVASRGDDWHVYDYALGDADGESEIYARPGAMSSLLPSSDFGEAWHPRLRIARKESIRIRRLDGVFDDAVSGLEEPRVFLKLDTQGYDLKAFSGAGDRIQDVRGMQSEVSCVPIYEGMPRMAEQITVYENAGFEITGMFPVTRDPATLRVIEFDVVMVRPDAVRSA
jgi:FkbM family methyltransferase